MAGVADGKRSLLPTRVDWMGHVHSQGFADVARQYPHIAPTHLPNLMRQLLGLANSSAQNAPSLLKAPGRSKVTEWTPQRSLMGYGLGSIVADDERTPRWEWPAVRERKLQPPKYLRNMELGVDRLRSRPMRFVYSRYELLKVALGHTCSVYNGLFDRTGSVFFTGADDSLVKVWCAKTGWLIRSIRGHQTFTTSQVAEGSEQTVILDMCVSEDNTMLATASSDQSVRVWRLQDWQSVCRINVGKDISTISFSQSPLEENQCLLVTAGDGKTRVYPWIAHERTFSRTPVVLDTGEKRTDRAITGTFNKIGTKIATGSTDGNVYIFAITPSLNIAELTPTAPAPTPLPDSSSAESLTSTPSSFPIPTLLARLPAHSVDLADKRRRKKEIGIKEVKFSRCGDKVLTGCGDGTAMVHWFETVDGLGEWKSRRLIIEEPTQRRTSVTQHLSLARRNLMASGAWSDVEDSAGEGEGAGASAGTSQNTMITESAGGSQAAAGVPLQTIGDVATVDPGTGVGEQGISEGGQQLGGGQVLAQAQFGNQQTGIPAVQQDGAPSAEEQKVGITQLSWSLDDALIITIMLDGLVRVWDAKSFKLIHTLSGHTSSEVYTLDVHPIDPRIVMTAGYDGKMIIWDVERGVELKRFEFGERALLSGTFSPDGSQIVLVDINGCVHLYGLPVEQPSPYKSSPYEQFFDSDWSIVRQDQDGNLMDEQAQIAPELVEMGSVVDMARSPYPAYAKWRKGLPVDGLPLWEGWTRKVRGERLGKVREEMGVLEMETKSANPNVVVETPKATPKKRRRNAEESDVEPDYQIFQDESFAITLPESSGDEYAGNNASASEDEVPSEPGELEVASDDPNFVDDDDGEGDERRVKRRKRLGRPKKKVKRRTKIKGGGPSNGKRKRMGDGDEEDDLEWDMVSDGSTGGRKKRKRVMNYAEMDPDLESSDVEDRVRRRSSLTSKDEGDLTETGSDSDVDVVMSSSPSPPPKSRKGKAAATSGGSGGGTGRAGAKSWFKFIGIGGSFVPRAGPGEWITQTEPKRTPYLPQIGDFVAYIKKGHRKFLEVAQREYAHLNLPTVGPGGIDPRMPGVVYGEVRKINFLATNPEVACVEIDVWVEHGGELTWGTTNRNGYEYSSKPPCAPMKSRMHPLKINDRKEVLRVAWADVEECTDFLVLFEDFVWGCFERELTYGMRVEVEYADGDYPGLVESFSDG
ncbi:Bromodomain and WD repeat-containing protein 3, partial [Rhizophlyctis rosea]